MPPIMNNQTTYNAIYKWLLLLYQIALYRELISMLNEERTNIVNTILTSDSVTKFLELSQKITNLHNTKNLLEEKKLDILQKNHRIPKALLLQFNTRNLEQI